MAFYVDFANYFYFYDTFMVKLFDSYGYLDFERDLFFTVSRFKAFLFV